MENSTGSAVRETIRLNALGKQEVSASCFFKIKALIIDMVV